MRKIIVQEFMSLDGVMQAPGGPEEDESGKFKYGGWTASYFAEVDEQASEFMQRWMESTDIMLGRNTYQLFAEYWPKHAEMWPGIMDVNKYVVSSTMSEADVENAGWPNSVLLKSVDDIKKLKETDGGPIKIHGSGKLAQTLFEHGLVDEVCLMTFPIILGKGKRLFNENSMPAAFAMTDKLVTTNGVILAYYKRDGDIKTGTIGE